MRAIIGIATFRCESARRCGDCSGRPGPGARAYQRRMPARSRRYTRRAPPECPRPRAIQVLYWHTQYNMRGKRMQAVFPIYLLNSTVSFLSVISCVRRGRLFHRAGGEAIRFTARAAVSSAGAGLRGPPNGTRAGPVAAVPPAAAGPPAGRGGTTIHPCHRPPYIYRHAKRPKSCTRFAFFQKNFRTAVDADKNFSCCVELG